MSFIYNKAYARPQEYNLWNVDNTSDAAKPLSIDAQLSLATKMNVMNPDATGKMIIRSDFNAASIIVSSNDLQAATLTLQEDNNSHQQDGFLEIKTKSVSGNGDNLIISKQPLSIIGQAPAGPSGTNRLITFYPAGTEESYDFVSWRASNRQERSQPIGVTLDTVSNVTTYDCSDNVSHLRVLNDATDVTVFISFPYNGKIIRIFSCCPTNAHQITLMAGAGSNLTFVEGDTQSTTYDLNTQGCIIYIVATGPNFNAYITDTL